MWRRGRGLRFVRAAFMVLVLGLTAACEEDGDRSVVAEELTRMDADIVTFGMEQALTREGVREGIVRADTAYFYQDSSAVHLRRIRMNLFDENGRDQAQVVADRGRLMARSQDMTGWGNVVLTVPADRQRIETEELHYSSTENRIWSDSATVMIQDGERTCGTSFYADLDFRDVVINNARTAGCGS